MRMRTTQWTVTGALGKGALVVSLLMVGACSVNPATGEKQFTAFMPAGQEASVGASEHEKVQQAYGKFMTGPVADYVSRVGAKVATNTERPDVQYKFFVIDSPIVNAFAIPGGYVYVSRGLLALANNEAEIAGVLGHEIGHITARHSAERMSHGLLVGLGAAVLSAAVGDPGVSRAAGLGSELYIKSYSRGQESQADELGVRYLSHAGYDPQAMASFLKKLDAQTKLEQQIAGSASQSEFNYFSTHPVTSDRIVQASAQAQNYPAGSNDDGRGTHMRAINGMIYGDSPEQGFVKGNNFYHTKLGFMFSVPNGFAINNTPAQVVAADKASGTVVLFDAAGNAQKPDPATYISQVWLAGKDIGKVDSTTVNGMRAATAAFAGSVNGKAATIRVMAIEWEPGQFFRFQLAIPTGASASIVNELKRTTYSFRRLTDSEKASIRPARIQIVNAGPSDTPATLAARMAFSSYREERFRVLNGLATGEGLNGGTQYKIVVE